MLQQTQVATVIPYYRRWMKRYPTLRKLSAAPLDDILKTWEGLGYYARARNLHKAAKTLIRLPRTSEEWRKVPGVGAYTAAAIASIAFGERLAVFDGNVRRVLSRLDALDVTEAPAPPRSAPGDYNQALMELGQRICTPRNPKCGECPLAADCRARASATQERWPTKKPARSVPHYDVAIGVIWKGDRIYVQRREEKGLLGGLWEFPGGKRHNRESYESCLRREIREETGFAIDIGPYLGRIPHRYSHFSVELHTFHCFLKKGRGGRLALRSRSLAGGRGWVTLEEIESLAMPRANRKIVEGLHRSGKPLQLVCR